MSEYRCPCCRNQLREVKQYTYDKIYRDECDDCSKSNCVEGIYCICNNNANNYSMIKMRVCDTCSDTSYYKSLDIYNRITILNNVKFGHYNI